MELWDSYDKNRNKTGKTLVRGNLIQDGEYHIVVNGWILRSDHRLLITKRVEEKVFGGLWESPGGSILKGETSQEGIWRELKEETGIKILVPGKKILTMRRDQYQSFLDVWLFKQDISLDEVKFQEGETCDALLATFDEIKEMYQNGLIVKTCFTKEIQEALKKSLNQN